MTTLGTISTLAMLAVSTLAVASNRPRPDARAGTVVVRFDRPDRWQCDADGGCMRCTSLGGDSGLTIQSRGAAPEHVEVPPHGAIRICPS